MHKIVLPAVSLIIGIVGLFIGIILGSLLGKVGALQILAFILRIPIILIKSPKKLKSKWRLWQELRDAQNIERLKRKRKIEELQGQIGAHKKEIKKIKAQIQRVKWEFSEPKEG